MIHDHYFHQDSFFSTIVNTTVTWSARIVGASEKSEGKNGMHCHRLLPVQGNIITIAGSINMSITIHIVILLVLLRPFSLPMSFSFS